MEEAPSTNLLTTKLHPPRLDERRVLRDRLLASFRQNPDCCLTLVCASAGYGKSTLVAEWTATLDRPVAWVCLDGSDSNLRVFLRYIVAAVQSLFPETCSGSAALLKAAKLPQARVLAHSIVNDLSSLNASFTLVLDDYHEIHEAEIHDFMAELLRHPPANVHWILGSRRDPPLPLPSLRARGQVLEIRFDDLCFSEEEAAQLLEKGLGRSLSRSAVSQVLKVTEGWAAGLQLVVLAGRKQSDPDTFLKGLRGNIREIQDYLLAETLARETPELRRCILRTSVVPRVGAGFCSKVCDCRKECFLTDVSMMPKMEETGAFVIPVDPRGEWFRYHPLFRDLLKRQLESELNPEGISSLHARASLWLEELGFIEDAIDQAKASGDTIRACEIVENHLDAELNADGWQTVERWLAMIPTDVQQERPKLLIGAAYVVVERSQLQDLPAIVERIEVLVDESDPEVEILGALNFLRGQVQYWQGEPEHARARFVEARGQIPSTQHLIAGENELLAALALQAGGHANEARNELIQTTRRAGFEAPIYLSRLIAGQVFVDALAGGLPAAADGARRLENLGRKADIGYVESWGSFIQVLASFHWAETEAAVRSSMALTDKMHLMHARAAVDVLAILTLASDFLGRHDVTTSSEQRLRDWADESGNPELLAVAGSCAARLAIRRGDFESAVRWQRSLCEPLDHPPMLFWAEVPLITECRVLVARGSKADLRLATSRLTALREGFAKLHNTCQLIAVDALIAVACEKQGRNVEAIEALARAVASGEPGGWIMPFAELGAPMASLLDRLEPTEATAGYLRRLRLGPDGADSKPASDRVADQASAHTLIEALTNRELDVLELLAERLYDKEVAERLSISPGTVKSHLKNIYQKLQVGNRRLAVERARSLGILKARGESSL